QATQWVIIVVFGELLQLMCFLSDRECCPHICFLPFLPPAHRHYAENDDRSYADPRKYRSTVLLPKIVKALFYVGVRRQGAARILGSRWRYRRIRCVIWV